jgi:hypothetical protein
MNQWLKGGLQRTDQVWLQLDDPRRQTNLSLQHHHLKATKAMIQMQCSLKAEGGNINLNCLLSLQALLNINSTMSMGILKCDQNIQLKTHFFSSRSWGTKILSKLIAQVAKSNNGNATMVSYRVNYEITRTGTAYTMLKL